MENRHIVFKAIFHHIIRKKIHLLLTVLMVFTLLPAGISTHFGLLNEVEAAISLSVPVSVTDSTMNSGKKVTWDCVYFGSYPQTEVKSDDPVYAKLTSSSTIWVDGDTTCDGEKYRRIQSSDATYIGSKDSFYRWDSSYHYFRYEPIKWRVLKVTSSDVLLLSDKLLDDQKYDLSDYSGATWESCNIRSWIRNIFIGRAFTNDEKSAIKMTTLVNTFNSDPSFPFGTSGGNATVDQVFLLSADETATSQIAINYGFTNNASIKDQGRIAKSTDYARAMGVEKYTSDAGYWWLRSIGIRYTTNGSYCRALALHPEGNLDLNGYDFTSYAAGIRPALYLSLDKDYESFYSYAGTVSSDGTIGNGQSGDNPGNPVTPSTYIINYDANGGSGAPAAQTKTSGVALTLSSEIPTRSGYTFLGWATSKSSVAANYKAGATYTSNGNVTLYAVWVSDGSGSGNGSDTGTGNSTGNQITVVPKAQTITASDKMVEYKGPVFYLGAKTNGNGKLTYSSSNPNVVTIDAAGKVTIKNYGNSIITVTASSTSTYKSAVKKVIVTVIPRKMKIKSVKSPKKGQLKVAWIIDKTAGGYQVQFARDSKFKKNVFQKNFSKKYKAFKKPVTGLNSKKKYYVRIRSFKKVNGTILYGIWSYRRMIKIK